MTVPKRWRERAGVLRGGPVRLTWLEAHADVVFLSALTLAEMINSG